MRPPHLNVLLFSIVLGVAVGIGVYTFIYAKGFSYMTDDPSACANCHIMDDHFSAWLKSSHQSVAVCNDCHTPAGPIAKYLTKAENGFWHSLAFTTGNFPDPLRIKPGNLEVTEGACMKCHRSLTAAMAPGPHLIGIEGRAAPDAEALSCVRCHASVGHWVR